MEIYIQIMIISNYRNRMQINMLKGNTNIIYINHIYVFIKNNCLKICIYGICDFTLIILINYK